MQPSPIQGVLLFAALLAMGACGQPAEQAKPVSSVNPREASQAVESLPALHVVLTWESYLGGENLVHKNYRARLEACQGAGWPTQALSAEEEAKLGRGQVEISIDASHQFARQVSWTFGAAGEDGQSTCLMKLEQHEDDSEVEDTDGMYEAIDDSTRAQERLTLQATGWTLLGEAEIQGQPCTRWRNDRQEVCMWARGLQWGFSDSPADVASCSIDVAGSYLTSIPLAGQPPGGGSGCRLQVESFSLGKGLLPYKR